MNPTASDLYVNIPLTNMSIAYMQNSDAFIADEVFPNIESDLQSATYYTYAKEDWFRADMRERAPATESAGSGWKVNLAGPFYCTVWALHKDIDDQLRGNTRAPFNLDRDATNWLSMQALLRREAQFVTNYFGPTIWNTDLTGVTGAPVVGTSFKQWDQTGSTPIEDIRRYRRAVQAATGFMPNKLVIGPQAWDVLADHAEILERIKYTQRGEVTEDIVAQILGLDAILVPNAIQTGANEGAAALGLGFSFGKGALLVYAAAAPGLMQPSAGYTFSWTGYMGAGAMGQRINSFRIPEIKSDRVESEMAFDMRVIGPDLGCMFNGAVS